VSIPSGWCGDGHDNGVCAGVSIRLLLTVSVTELAAGDLLFAETATVVVGTSLLRCR